MGLTELSSEGKRLYRLLVERLPQIDADRLSNLPTYSAIHSELKLQTIGPTFGISLDNQGLANLAYWSKERNLPAITGLVVEQSTGLPASGFWTLYGRDSLDDVNWWAEEVKKCKTFDWNAIQSNL